MGADVSNFQFFKYLVMNNQELRSMQQICYTSKPSTY